MKQWGKYIIICLHSPFRAASQRNKLLGQVFIATSHVTRSTAWDGETATTVDPYVNISGASMTFFYFIFYSRLFHTHRFKRSMSVRLNKCPKNVACFVFLHEWKFMAGKRRSKRCILSPYEALIQLLSAGAMKSPRIFHQFCQSVYPSPKYNTGGCRANFPHAIVGVLVITCDIDKPGKKAPLK